MEQFSRQQWQLFCKTHRKGTKAYLQNVLLLPRKKTVLWIMLRMLLQKSIHFIRDFSEAACAYDCHIKHVQTIPQQSWASLYLTTPWISVSLNLSSNTEGGFFLAICCPFSCNCCHDTLWTWAGTCIVLWTFVSLAISIRLHDLTSDGWDTFA